MNLDDRLRTVLDVAADSDDAARGQYRQLVDLLGSGRAVADGALVAASFLRLGALARRIPSAERARMLADPALRLRSPALVAQLCEGERDVAEAAIHSADLDETGWSLLISVLDSDLQTTVRTVRTTGRARSAEERSPLLLTRKTGDGAPRRSSITHDLTPSAPVPSRVPIPPRAPEPDSGPSVEDIVARIERFRLKRRERSLDEALGTARPDTESQEDEALAAPPPVAAPREVDCRIAPGGRITWAQRLAPMLTGLILSAGSEAAAQIDDATATALRRQQAVRGGKVTIAASPAITGEWRLDAAPHFDPVGRFLGHHARLTRQVGAPADARGDYVRQALHELRTPINALQGFSEIIQQQLFGPVPHQYRSLAAGIAGETATLLAALEDIDRLVRLRHGTRKLTEGHTAFGPMLTTLAEHLEPMLAARGARLAGNRTAPDVTVPVAESDLERALWRLLSAVAGAADDGDCIVLEPTVRGDSLRLSISLPSAMAAMDDDTHYGTAPDGDPSQDVAMGLLGRGFALRLAGAEAKAAGGSLERTRAWLVLTLPCEQDATASDSEVAA